MSAYGLSFPAHGPTRERMTVITCADIFLRHSAMVTIHGVNTDGNFRFFQFRIGDVVPRSGE